MTTTSAPVRSGPVTQRPGLAVARLLRLELRHNAMLWMLPVTIGLGTADHFDALEILWPGGQKQTIAHARLDATTIVEQAR